MLTPSDKVEIISKAIDRLVGSEGVEPSFIERMAVLLKSAEEEECIFMIEQDDYAQSMEDQAVQQGIDIARGK
tara:strand:+ start:377 stop:595 length:219 start_codon:yes stop_codon:yes gene_type:complete